jgi:RNA polymerase sigma-70 factor, ECF subfamily
MIIASRVKSNCNMPSLKVSSDPARLSDVEDHALLSQIANGDRRAFEVLYDRYASHVLGLAIRMMRDRAQGEDVLQETFWRVWTRAANFSADVGGGNVRAWVLTITHHLAIDAQRKQRGQVSLDDDNHQGSVIHVDNLIDQNSDVFEHVFASISTERLKLAIGKLEERHRNIIELSYFHGLTHREIAKQLNEPLGTVHSRALQGMAALRALLWQQLKP